jgi:F420-dependent oxidoreductase-like protein
MKLGLSIMQFRHPGGTPEIGPRLRELALAAEDAGFASLWAMDHFFQIGLGGPADDPMLEAYATLGYLAGITGRSSLGALVTGVMYRQPGLLLKAVTTLDVLSGGRAYLGLGASWNDREARGLGLPFPGRSERYARLEETLQIARQVWSGSRAPFNGRYYQLAEPIISPQPISRPRPPILVGGQGEQRTLRLVAQYADACNLTNGDDPAIIRRKLDVLRHHCQAVGRDYDAIEKTCMLGIYLAHKKLNASEVAANCRALAVLGIQHVILVSPICETYAVEVGRQVLEVL